MSELSPTPGKIVVSRPLVGILAVICLGAGIVLQFRQSTSALGGPFLRVGILLAALWLALPLKRSSTPSTRVSPAILVALLAGLIFVARRPGALIPALFFLAVLWLLLRPWNRPGQGQKP